jgi:hypothetical protein
MKARFNIPAPYLEAGHDWTAPDAAFYIGVSPLDYGYSGARP